MKIAVTGSDGQLGFDLTRHLGSAAFPLNRRLIDLRYSREIRAALRDANVNAVIHCAGYTAVDAAERDADECQQVNVGGIAAMAEMCRSRNWPLVYLSTNYVFPGERPVGPPYVETDAADPKNIFGLTKYLGEQLVANSCSKHIIIRTCGLYNDPARRSRNFVNAMLGLTEDSPPVWVVDDQFCTPTYTRDVARAILFLLDGGHWGTFHVTNGGHTSWYDFAAEIVRLSGSRAKLRRTATDNSGALAPRPLYSVLNTRKYAALGGPPMRSWQEALRHCLASSGALGRRVVLRWE